MKPRMDKRSADDDPAGSPGRGGPHNSESRPGGGQGGGGGVEQLVGRARYQAGPPARRPALPPTCPSRRTGSPARAAARRGTETTRSLRQPPRAPRAATGRPRPATQRSRPLRDQLVDDVQKLTVGDLTGEAGGDPAPAGRAPTWTATCSAGRGSALPPCRRRHTSWGRESSGTRAKAAALDFESRVATPRKAACGAVRCAISARAGASATPGLNQDAPEVDHHDLAAQRREVDLAAGHGRAGKSGSGPAVRRTGDGGLPWGVLDEAVVGFLLRTGARGRGGTSHRQDTEDSRTNEGQPDRRRSPAGRGRLQTPVREVTAAGAPSRRDMRGQNPGSISDESVPACGGDMPAPTSATEIGRKCRGRNRHQETMEKRVGPPGGDP